MKVLASLSVICCVVYLAACQEKEVHYFPLNEGKQWRYQIHTQDMNEEKSFQQLVFNQPRQTLDGAEVYVQNINDSLLFFYQIDDDGVRRIARKFLSQSQEAYEKQEHLILRLPLEKGVNWELPTTTSLLSTFKGHYAVRAPIKMGYTVDNVSSSVKVQAGKFSQCAEVIGTGKARIKGPKVFGMLEVTVKSTDWYCPGVGLVKSSRIEMTDNERVARGSFSKELLEFASH